MQPNRPFHPLVTGLLLLLFLALALLVSLPPLIGGLATRWLQDQGIEASVQDIDLHLLRGRLAIWGLRLRGPQGFRMDLGSAEWHIHPGALLLDHRLRLAWGTVRDLDLRLATDLQGRPLLPFLTNGENGEASDAMPQSRWSLGIDHLELARVRLRLDHPKEDLQIHIARLTLANLHDWQPRQPGRLELVADINGAPVHASLGLRPFAVAPELSGSVRIDKLALAPLRPWLPHPVDRLQGRLDVRARLEARKAAGHAPALQMEGQLTGVGLELALGPRRLQAAELEAPIGLHLEGSGADRRFRLEGRLRGTGLSLSDPALPVPRMSIGQLSADGLKLALPLQRGETAGLTLEADLTLTGLELGAKDKAYPLASLDRAQGKGLSLQLAQNRITLSSLTASGLSLPAEDDSAPVPLKLGSFRAGPVDWNGKLADLGRIELSGLEAHLLIRPDGSPSLPALAQHLQSSPARHARPEPKDGKHKGNGSDRGNESASGALRLPLRIASLEMTGDNRMDFTDRSLHPAYRGHYRIRTLRIAPLDGARPDRISRIDIEARLHQYTRLSLHGRSQLLVWPPREAELEIALRSVSLPRLNPWLRQYTGYVAETGQLHLEAAPKIHESMLETTLRLNLNGYRLTRADPERAAAFDEKIGIGLAEALSMVRDSKGNVTLTLPIKGDLRNPHFDPAPVIAEALKHAITQAATAYAVYAIQPYGAALLLTRIAGKTVLKLHFDPLFFAPGKADAQALPTDYLDKLAGLLRERPGIRLRICGIATRRDRAALPEKRRTDDDLLALARQRSIAVKEAMISRGIDGERLLLCQPRLDTDETAQPRVELES